MLSSLYDEQKRLREVLNKIQKELETLPRGKLYSQKHSNDYQYYVEGKYLRVDQKDVAEKICLSNYYQKLIKRFEKNLFWLDGLIKSAEQNSDNYLYDNMNKGKRVLLTNAVYKSKHQIVDEFIQQNDKNRSEFLNQHPIETDIYTNLGEQVRSKSEKIIADVLYSKGVPYKYEFPLKLANGNNLITIHPDFTVINARTAKKYYIEHMGMMSDEEYVRKALNKIKLYERNDILLGRELIVFYETDNQPLNTPIMCKYIDEFLL